MDCVCANGNRFGKPEPWAMEQVQVYLAKLRKEADSRWHIYYKANRVWAQKPYDSVPTAESKVEVPDLETRSAAEDAARAAAAEKEKLSLPSPSA